MKTTPFCCNINSGSVEERNEFKRMLEKASSSKYGFISAYYGYNKYGEWDMTNSYKTAEVNFNGNILPLSEGIAILKEMVGEETKPNGDYVMLPRKLTAENGAKGLLIGEFKESVHFTVDGEENKIDVDVSWTTIKAIYDMIVENLQPKP